MEKATPKISQYMTITSSAIDSEATIYEALQMMEKNKIRHLPVIKEKKVFGLLSDRDVKSVFSFAGADPKKLHVGDVCGDIPYITKPEALLSEVANEMATQKIGSALILNHGKLVGIFTATDACQALSEICEVNHSVRH